MDNEPEKIEMSLIVEPQAVNELVSIAEKESLSLVSVSATRLVCSIVSSP